MRNKLFDIETSDFGTGMLWVIVGLFLFSFFNSTGIIRIIITIINQVGKVQHAQLVNTTIENLIK